MSLPATEADNSPANIFRDKVAAKIRGDIGDLMPDEMVRQIVADAIHAELYRDVGTDRRWPKPWIQEEVKSVFGKKIEEYVFQQMDEHCDKMHEMIVDEMKAKLPDIIGHILLAAMKGQTYAIENAIQQAMSRY